MFTLVFSTCSVWFTRTQSRDRQFDAFTLHPLLFVPRYIFEHFRFRSSSRVHISLQSIPAINQRLLLGLIAFDSQFGFHCSRNVTWVYSVCRVRPC